MIEIDAPKNELVTSSVFKDSVNSTTAILGIYISLIGSSADVQFGNGAITLYNGLAADELTTSAGVASDIDFYTNSISSSDFNNLEKLWKNGFTVLYQANACIEGLANATGISTALKNQLTGEAKLTRAFILFNLLNLYGDVPLVINTDYIVNATLPRSSGSLVYQHITKDVTEAQQLLSHNYIAAGRLRPNKYAAMALLSRVYLYQKEWAKAENLATQIIESGMYTLEQDLNKVFLAENNEAIWQLPLMQNEHGTGEGKRFIPASSTEEPRNPITNFLLNAFETDDKRKFNWLNYSTVNGTPFYYPYKYKLAVAGNPAEHYVIFRLGEQYLIRSEARAHQNNITGSLADLNIIRRRATLPDVSYNDQASLLTGIEQERRIELFCEWGHRWNDLRRTDRVDAVLGMSKAPNWQPTDALFPIPFNELKSNPFLVQNPGYQ